MSTAGCEDHAYPGTVSARTIWITSTRCLPSRIRSSTRSDSAKFEYGLNVCIGAQAASRPVIQTGALLRLPHAILTGTIDGATYAYPRCHPEWVGRRPAETFWRSATECIRCSVVSSTSASVSSRCSRSSEDTLDI